MAFEKKWQFVCTDCGSKRWTYTGSGDPICKQCQGCVSGAFEVDAEKSPFWVKVGDEQ